MSSGASASPNPTTVPIRPGCEPEPSRAGDDWVLTGTKMWITNGSVADVAVIWARTDEGVRGFVVPTDTTGFTANTIKSKMSLRASVTSELVLEGVRLPDSARLPGATSLGAPLRCLERSPLRHRVRCSSVRRGTACRPRSTMRARENSSAGRSPASSSRQQKLADMTLEYGKGLLLALHLGRRKDAGDLVPDQVSLGKLNNVREALEIARTARTILGASGITAEYPVMRHANNLESVLTYEGTSEMHSLIIGQALTGIPAFR